MPLYHELFDARRFDGFIFDLDGTLYRGEALLPGADRTVAALRAAGKRVLFLSNKPIDSRENYAAKLTRLGIPADVEDVIHSSVVLARYLAAHHPSARVYPVGEPPLLAELRRAGLQVVEDPEQEGWRVDFVIAAFDRTFDYRKLNNAHQCIKRGGARLVATNADRACPVAEGDIPDAAAVIGAIEGSTGVRCELVAGKPSPLVVEAALSRLGTPPGRAVMVGDRLETDIAMGRRAGIATVLVLTGVTTPAMAEAAPPEMRPDWVVPSVAELLC